MQNNNDKLYRRIDNKLCPVCSSLYLLSFLSLPAINTVIFRNRIVQDRRLIFCMSIDNEFLHRGIENRHSLVCFSLSMIFFFLSTFLSKISPQLYKIESSYLVYRITATSCIVG